MAKDTKIMTASINLPVETLETIVDAENRTLNLKRIGYGMDRSVSY